MQCIHCGQKTRVEAASNIRVHDSGPRVGSAFCGLTATVVKEE